MHRISEKMLTSERFAARYLMFLVNALINVFALPACAQTVANGGWHLLEDGLGQKNTGQRLAAVRVLGLIPDDPHATELAEKALTDKNSSVRAAAATSLGHMRASGVHASLEEALNDKNLSVVMAAAHALRCECPGLLRRLL